MDRRRQVAVLAESGFEPGRYVTYPDHPLLGRGPDVLGQVGSRLVAWFVYTARSPHPGSRSESARILLSRLALPGGTQCTMVLVDRSESDFAGSDLFDQMELRTRDGRVTKREDFEGGAAEVAERIRPYHFERFSEAWANPPSGERERRGPSTLTFWRTGLGPLPRWAIVAGDRLVAHPSSDRRRRNVIPMVQSLAVAATSLDFGLARGLAGARETVSMLEAGDAHLALHSMDLGRPDGGPTRTTDPYKAFRAAAFAGAAVVYPETS